MAPVPQTVDPHIHRLLYKAIEQRRMVQFLYHSKKRIAEPHDYGIKNGCPRLLAYQTRGSSSSGPLPNWRELNVDQISSMELLDSTFPGNRPAPSGKHQKWDLIFIRVKAPDEE